MPGRMFRRSSRFCDVDNTKTRRPLVAHQRLWWRKPIQSMENGVSTRVLFAFLYSFSRSSQNATHCCASRSTVWLMDSILYIYSNAMPKTTYAIRAARENYDDVDGCCQTICNGRRCWCLRCVNHSGIACSVFVKHEWKSQIKVDGGKSHIYTTNAPTALFDVVDSEHALLGWNRVVVVRDYEWTR